MEQDRIEVTPMHERKYPEQRKIVDPVTREIRDAVLQIMTHIKRQENLPSFASERASDSRLHLNSLVELCMNALQPIFDEYRQLAIAWYQTDEAEAVKADLVLAYREELRPDGSVKATGRPVYKSPKQKSAKDPVQSLDKETLAKLLLAELEKRK